jgi:RNA polymerase sigma factor (sigma-70 family)
VIDLFDEQCPSDAKDSELVALAQQGNRAALEALVTRHQPWIYNIALRMVGSPQDAEDVTQEILIKMMTKLSTFQQRSSFRTWLYRIVTNHVINMKKLMRERVFSSFESHGSLLDDTPDMDPPDTQSAPVDAGLLVEETKMGCMMGMLLCLDRKQRLAFTLGAVLGASSTVGGEIMEITPVSFRQELSRARRQLANFMDEKCGLMNKENPCRCARKTRAAIMAGYVDPQRLEYDRDHLGKIKSIVAARSHTVDDVLELRAQDLFQEHLFLKAPDYVQRMHSLLHREEFQRMLGF